MPRSTTLPHPFLKWAGGKGQLLPQLARLYPPRRAVRRYLEPFVGSGAVFFDVKARLDPTEVVLADSNAELVGAWRAIRDDVDGVVRILHTHDACHDRAYYYEIRAVNPHELSQNARAARTIYLNKTCFNGLYRVNSKGRFNVPMGKYKNPLILDEPNLRAVSAALRGVDVRHAHFRDALSLTRRGDFVYFDPPYHPLSRSSSFTSYTDRLFGEDDQRELAQVFAKLAARGCKVMLSNSDCAFVRDLYRDFEIRRVLARRSINSKGDRRGRIAEVVVLTYDVQEDLWPDAGAPSRAATS